MAGFLEQFLHKLPLKHRLLPLQAILALTHHATLSIVSRATCVRDGGDLLLFLPDSDLLVGGTRGDASAIKVEGQIQHIVLMQKGERGEHGLLLQQSCLMKESLLVYGLH